ncbi:MAG: putative metal-binding motif-containing protein [Alphaproteobacteria bacterium]|nr:putative metal-binding motif-containing protein [Alphaproteobacteria bacterium]
MRRNAALLPLLWCMTGCPLIGSGHYEDKIDVDGDGEADVKWGGADCDDSDPAVGPGQTEVAGNGVDDDCDGTQACFVDADSDGFHDEGQAPALLETCPPGPTPRPGDCDDHNGEINPGEVDTVIGVDANCDGEVLCYLDADGDGHGTDQETTVTSTSGCTGPNEATTADDCDDTTDTVSPSQTEISGNTVDEDCADGPLCPGGDADGDAICDAQDECPVADDGTDADGDGVVAACDPDDGDEDSDDDGLSDGVEDADHDGVVDAGETDPADPDTDDDGICDHPRADNESDGITPADPCHTRWFVDSGVGTSGDGSSWNAAFLTLAEADAALSAGDEVWVAAATYRSTGIPPVLSVNHASSWYGGFVGTEATIDDRDIRANETVVDGQSGRPASVVSADDVTIDGFVFRGGSAAERGGGMAVNVTGVSLVGVRFDNNAGTTGSNLEVGPDGAVAVSDTVFVGGAGSSVHVLGELRAQGMVVLDAEDIGIDVDRQGPGIGRFDATDLDVQTSGSSGLVVRGQADVVSATFYQNLDPAGAAVGVDGGTVSLTNVTFYDNTRAVAVVTGTADVANAAVFASPMSGATSTFQCDGQASDFTVLTGGTPPWPRVVLAGGSACIDAGDNAAADSAFTRFGADWRMMTTVDGPSMDTPPVDAGRHYLPGPG